jgi:hypothetical protein
MPSGSLHSRGTAVHALCAIAESEIHDGQLERAAITLNAIRRLVKEVITLANDPFITSAPGAVREVSELLADLESRIQQVEAKFPPAEGPMQSHKPC